MAEFILNPRRAPRAPVRCDARIALKEGGYFSSPTSDYGPQGCQLRTPVPLAPGSRLFVELVNERLGRPVELAGRVAWTSKAPPWRMGVAFDTGSLGAASGFFEALAAAYPGIDTYGRAPDRIPEDRGRTGARDTTRRAGPQNPHQDSVSGFSTGSGKIDYVNYDTEAAEKRLGAASPL